MQLILKFKKIYNMQLILKFKKIYINMKLIFKF